MACPLAGRCLNGFRTAPAAQPAWLDHEVSSHSLKPHIFLAFLLWHATCPCRDMTL